MGISRGSVYYESEPISDADLELMRRIDELHLEHPFAGSRMLRDFLRLQGVPTRPSALPTCAAPNTRQVSVRRTRGSMAVMIYAKLNSYWTTSSARISSDCGIVTPSIFAAFRLITSSNRVGSSIGSSAGFAPRRMRSM